MIRYGKEEVTRIIDGNGSLETVITSMHKGEPVNPIRHRYEIRERIVDLDTMMISVSQFLSEAVQGEGKRLEVAIKIEKTPVSVKRGSFDLIKCYTVLEY